jgi:hypothetical protein
MNVVFYFLFLISILALIVGMIKPSLFSRLLGNNPSRMKVGLVFGVIAVAMIVGLVVFTPKESNQNKTETKTTKPTTTSAKKTSTKAAEKANVVNYTFDVPSLVGKNIDEIRTVLGKPKDGELTEPNQAQLDLGVDEWDNTFEKNGKELLVTYKVKSRKVVDFFISTDDSSGKTKDETHLLEMGNLKENDSRYTIKFVEAINKPGEYTGVTATPR